MGGPGGLASELTGGRQTLAGTFVAEKTHSNPPKYTLVSLSASARARYKFNNGDAGDNGGGAGVGGTGLRRRAGAARSEKGFGKCTVMPLCIEPLLSKEELPARARAGPSAGATKASSGTAHTPAVGSRAASRAGVERDASSQAQPLVNRISNAPGADNACVDAQDLPDSPSGIGHAAREASKRRGSPSGKQKPSSQSSKAQPEQRPASSLEVFTRLADESQLPRPWVASKTDGQLLCYLAKRAGYSDFEVMESVASTHAPPSQSPRANRRRHRNPRELFDACLDRPSSCCAVSDYSHSSIDQNSMWQSTSASFRSNGNHAPSLRPSSQRTQSSRPLESQLVYEEIVPENAVAAFFQAEEEARLGGTTGNRPAAKTAW